MLNVDEGYFFGIGAFETIAVEDGKPILLEEHYARLGRAMGFLNLHQDMEEVRAKAEEILKIPEMRSGRKVLKITVSGKNILVSSRENTYASEDYQRGFTAIYSQVKRNETSSFVYHKTLNYGDCLFEKRLAKANGVDEPIFLNTKGEIAEGATANVFFVKDGELFTPSVSCGLLPGILRGYICDRYSVQERAIRPKEVPEFDEMFLTNSLLGVMPVTKLDSFCFPSRKKGEQILKEYRKFCKIP